MRQAITRLRRDDEQGFTLIELMVVVLIIAILISIAIPTFLGARKRAQDRAAQSSLRNALTSAKTIFTDEEDYTKATTTALAAAEPSLSFVSGATASTKPTQVSVNPSAASTWQGGAYSKSGKCFYIKDVSTTGTEFATKDPADTTNCKGDDSSGFTAGFSSDSSTGWQS